MKYSCIFVVDDDSATLESFKTILEGEGYQIFTATNGAELKALFLKQMPDLILMDHNLGEVSGGMLTKDIKKNPQTLQIPVIVFSADAQLRTTAMKMGADDFIEKPIEIPLLLAKIEQHITHE